MKKNDFLIQYFEKRKSKILNFFIFFLLIFFLIFIFNNTFSSKNFIGKIHLEGIYVTDSKEKVRPICECGTRMKSMGADQGVRCPTCKTRSTIKWTTVQREPPISGWVQPPYDKRRHLAKSMS